MMHSIIIPHRNRNRYLTQCIWSILRSAEYLDVHDFEIVVVDNLSDELPESKYPVRIVRCWDKGKLYNKPKSLNLGIEAARGEILSFLDADAIVGKCWLMNAYRLRSDSTQTKLCYRVRYLPNSALEELEAGNAPVSRWFSDYDATSGTDDKYRRGHEGYIIPGLNGESGTVFGNSQFSMLRDVLGDMRFNEEFAGRGFEDLWLIREVYERDPTRYKAQIVTEPDYALFHIENTMPERNTAEWGIGQYETNKLRYFGAP